jgi:hypothetical protein
MYQSKNKDVMRQGRQIGLERGGGVLAGENGRVKRQEVNYVMFCFCWCYNAPSICFILRRSPMMALICCNPQV